MLPHLALFVCVPLFTQYRIQKKGLNLYSKNFQEKLALPPKHPFLWLGSHFPDEPIHFMKDFHIVIRSVIMLLCLLV